MKLPVVAPWLANHRVRDDLGAFRLVPWKEGKSLHPPRASEVTFDTMETLKVLNWAMGAGLVIQLHAPLLP